MENSIICPSCKKPIPLTEALTHQLSEKFKRQSESEKQQLVIFYKKRLQEETVKKTKEVEEAIKKKIEQETALKMRDTQNERDELKSQNKALQEQILETNRLLRQLRTEKEQVKIEMEKQLAASQEKIREAEQKKLADQYRLKMLEKDKQLQDALKVNNELKIKLEQGSQQTQGEVLELELENTLRQEFPYDEVKPVAKGTVGADVIQIVKNASGRVAGQIVWETKRTKAWSADWTKKLKEDQRQMKAELAVIISQVLPKDIEGFGYFEGVWVGTYVMIRGLAYALRRQILEVFAAKSAIVGKNDKMEILYNYLTGVEFRQRIEAIVEAFSTLQEDLEKEKRWFAGKWAKQEKSLRKVIDHTLGMHGDLHGIVGRELGEIQEQRSKSLTDTESLFNDGK